MKEAKITLPEGFKAANIRVDGNVLSYDVVPEEKQVEEIEGWIARDGCGNLYLCLKEQPYKGYIECGVKRDAPFLHIEGRLFPSVKWEDSKPTKVRIKIETI